MSDLTFEIDIFYSQLAVFQSGLENPYNNWNDIHLNQGFVWREGSVSFGTLFDDEEGKITVRVTDKFELDNDVIRAITVPFYIGNKGIEVGSVMKTTAFDLEKGMYELVFTIKQLDNESRHYSFDFIKSNNPKANVIKADEELNPPTVLLMKAEPAI
jgi:hypothetical protein